MKKLLIISSFALLLPFSAGAVSLDANANVNVEVDTHAGGGKSGSTSMGATTTIETGENGSTHVETPSGNVIDVDRSGDGHTVVTISNSSDDKAGIEVAAGKDKSVEAVDVDENGKINVAYKHSARFLGFIPVTITSHTTVATNNDGTAQVHTSFPWWSFLVNGISGISTRVEGDLNTSPAVNAASKANASAQVRLQLIKAIIASLQAESTAEVTASAQ